MEAFEKYKNDTTYKTFDDFMPEIVKLQNSLNPQQVYDQMPTITETNIQNGCDTVDYNLDHITAFFNTQMYTGYDKATIGIFPTPKLEFIEVGKWNDKVIGKNKWNEEGTEWTFYIKKLEPNTEYQILFPTHQFIDKEDKYLLRDDYTLTFKTKPKE
jgi:hypothetical protein